MYKRQVYLYMEDWDNVLKYANMVLKEKPVLTSLASAPEEAMQYQGSNTWAVYNESTSDEIIWMYGGSKEYGCYVSGGAVASMPYSASVSYTHLISRHYPNLPYRDTPWIKLLPQPKH